MRTHTLIPSPLGGLTAVMDDGGLCGLYMDGGKYVPGIETLGQPVPLVRAASVEGAAAGSAANSGAGSSADNGAGAVAAQLAEYFAGSRREFSLPLAPVGNEFQLKVWEQLLRIPYGELRSYGDIARELGDRNLAQAVGSANGHNPISIIVPCHRVVGADGSLVGYAGGLDRKQFLLELENPSRTHTEALF